MTQSTRKYICGGLTTAFAVSALPLTAGGAQAADYDVGSIHIAQPWVRATPKGASSGAGYLTVTNNGSVPDRLTCAGTDAAAQCQVHTMRKLLYWGRQSVIVVLGFSQHLALPTFLEDWRSQEVSATQADHILVRN
jgi:hypothetical protein